MKVSTNTPTSQAQARPGRFRGRSNDPLARENQSRPLCMLRHGLEIIPARSCRSLRYRQKQTDLERTCGFCRHPCHMIGHRTAACPSREQYKSGIHASSMASGKARRMPIRHRYDPRAWPDRHERRGEGLGGCHTSRRLGRVSAYARHSWVAFAAIRCWSHGDEVSLQRYSVRRCA
jgi:hypothetical protein